MSVDPKFQVEEVAPTNHYSQKTRLNDLLFGIKIWTDLSSVLSQCTRLTDRQTDGQIDRILIARPRLDSMQREKNHRKNRKLLLTFKHVAIVCNTTYQERLFRMYRKWMNTGTLNRCSRAYTVRVSATSSRAGLTMVPNVPWHRAPRRKGAPLATKKFFRLFNCHSYRELYD